MSWKVLALVSMRLMSAAATAGCITFSSPAVTTNRRQRQHLETGANGGAGEEEGEDEATAETAMQRDGDGGELRHSNHEVSPAAL
eukprot:SM000041S15464  [mRNA]  locus=s41:272151:272681:- [translate_table: standard]